MSKSNGWILSHLWTDEYAAMLQELLDSPDATGETGFCLGVVTSHCTVNTGKLPPRELLLEAMKTPTIAHAVNLSERYIERVRSLK